MKNIKIIMPIILIIIILAIILTYIGIEVNKQKINNIIEDEAKQVQTLKAIYKDFLKNCDGNILLDKSTLKNIITGNNFSEENKNILKQIETNLGNSHFTYTLYINYNTNTRVLKLTLEGTDTSIFSTSYKLNVKNSNITYTPASISNLSIS